VIRTVTLNPALDRSVSVPGLALDRVNRASSSRIDPGGKGINVSKVIAALGGRSLALGFLGGRTGELVAEALDGLGIAHRFTRVAGETRTNLKLDDPLRGTHTDINEAGPAVGPGDIARLEDELFRDAAAGDLFVFSGSAPLGVGPGIYAAWIRRARAAGALSILDADGDLLRLGLEAGPELCKPNAEELGRLLGRGLSSRRDMLAAAAAVLAGGAGRLVLSLGAEGALFAEKGRAFLAAGLKVEAVSTVGAGDSMVAALALGLEGGGSLESLIAPALGSATASVLVAGSGACSRQDAERYATQVTWEELAI
jgi:1-phosphofructokinase